jgi:hypothetical protein
MENGGSTKTQNTHVTDIMTDAPQLSTDPLEWVLINS